MTRSGVLVDNIGRAITINGKALYFHDYLRFTSANVNIVERCNYTSLINGVTVNATSNYGRASFIFPVTSGVRYTVEFDSVVQGGYKRVYFDNKALNPGDGWNPVYGSIEVGGHKSFTFTSNSSVLFIGIYASANTTTGSITLTNVELKES